MRPDPITVNLSGKDYIIRPLSLGQLRKADDIMSDKTLGNIDRAIKIIGVGLSRDYPEDAAKVEDLEVEILDISPIMIKILEIGGMVPKSSGELVPVVPPSTGTDSMAVSLPTEELLNK